MNTAYQFKEKITGTYPGHDTIHQIHYAIYLPDKTPRAILQIAHGMAEHFGRYEDFAKFLTAQGYAVCGEDHLGHGLTGAAVNEFGYYGEIEGKAQDHLVEDLHTLHCIMRAQYGSVPYFLLGHSMGSMLARIYLTKYGDDLTAAIIMGTMGPGGPAQMALPVVKLLKGIYGPKHKSKLLYALAFGGYNKKFPDPSERLGWQSQDPEVLKAFRADPLSNFMMSVSAFQTMLEMILFISRPQWPAEVPMDLPLLITAGDDDPVGDFGKGPRAVYDAFLALGRKNVTLQMYPGMRHEILNEPCKSETYQNILSWMEQYL